MERKLATIRRIKSIDPIPNADKIEKLTIDGWQLVSEKGNFKILAENSLLFKGEMKGVIYANALTKIYF